MPSTLTAEAALTDAHGTHLTTAALLVDESPSSFTRGDLEASPLNPARPAKLSPPRELRVVDGDALAVRLRIDSSTLRVLAWFPRASLQCVPTRRTQVAPGVTLLAGAQVKLGEPRDGACRVTAELSEVTFEGWVPEGDLGDVFERGPDLTKTTVSARVDPGSVVVARPDGAPLARFVGRAGIERLDPRIDVSVEAGAPPGFVAVRWSGLGEERVVVAGLVDERNVTRTPPDVISFESGMGIDGVGGGVSDTARMTVLPHTRLFSSGGNEAKELIGITTAATDAFVTTLAPHGWCDVEMLFPVRGFQRVSVACDRLRA